MGFLCVLNLCDSTSICDLYAPALTYIFPSVCLFCPIFICLLCFMLLYHYYYYYLDACLSTKKRQKGYMDPDGSGGREELEVSGGRRNCNHNRFYKKYLFSIEEKKEI